MPYALPERAAYLVFSLIAQFAWLRQGRGVRQLEANLARVSSLREALEGGCSVDQVASALGVHVSEVDAVAWSGRPDDLLPAGTARA